MEVRKREVWREKLGNTVQRLCGRCAVRFFVRLYRNDAGILSYFKEFMCKMTENMQADDVQSLYGVAPKEREEGTPDFFEFCFPSSLTSGVVPSTERENDYDFTINTKRKIKERYK